MNLAFPCWLLRFCEWYAFCSGGSIVWSLLGVSLFFEDETRGIKRFGLFNLLCPSFRNEHFGKLRRQVGHIIFFIRAINLKLRPQEFWHCIQEPDSCLQRLALSPGLGSFRLLLVEEAGKHILPVLT